MKSVENTLNKIKDEVALLLREMYPELLEAIDYHKQENFQEWFAMLFEGHKWKASTIIVDTKLIITSESRMDMVEQEIESYQGLPDLGYITIVPLEGEYHLIDGYHRFLLAKEREIDTLKAVLWTKTPNMHPNCQKIKQLIINNL